ncbi:histidine kinase [Streptomyces sp. NPDC047971]|uniref:sensor histidine kinase n=1 Tax=Streptomyces sp. NPDC047971 TaxID=3154499 RepID=UPI0034054E36
MTGTWVAAAPALIAAGALLAGAVPVRWSRRPAEREGRADGPRAPAGRTGRGPGGTAPPSPGRSPMGADPDDAPARRHGPLPGRWAYAGRAAGLAGGVLLAVLPLVDGTSEESRWLLGAACLLVVLQAVAYRWAPRREAFAGGGIAAAATALWTVPLLPGASFFEYVGMSAFWCVPSLGAAVVGGYPRFTDRRRTRAVREARHAQQLRLAHDLHDFVAHDISGIVAQAQAARFVAGQDPAAALPALERIERAGLAALASIDRTVSLLRASASADRAPVPGLGELADLVRRFGEEGRTESRLDLADGVEHALSREAAATLHRVAAEALTNVRRHAPAATRVDVELTLLAGEVTMTVTNDGVRPGPHPRPRERGGSGLPALAERVRASGGTLRTATHDGNWCLTATLDRTGDRP